MQKTVCDICGKDCSSDREYVLPYYNKYYAFRDGISLGYLYNILETHKLNLCQECKTSIASAISNIENNKGK